MPIACIRAPQLSVEYQKLLYVSQHFFLFRKERCSVQQLLAGVYKINLLYYVFESNQL